MEEKELIAKIKLLKKIQPSQNWLVFCRQELVKESRLAGSEKKEQSPVFSIRPSFFAWLLQNKFWSPLFRPAVVALSIIIILGFGGLATVKAALKSLPGDWLYPIKISLERAQIELVSDETEKAELEAKMTGRRAQELTEIMSQPSPGREEKIEQAIQQIKLQLSTAQSQLPKLKEKAKTKADSEKLKAVAKTVKENTAKLEEAISQAKGNLSEDLSENKTKTLSVISDISDMAKETNIQVLEILETVENLDTLNIPTESESTSSPSIRP